MTLRQLITTGLVLASSLAAAAQTPGTTPAASTQVDVQAGVGKTRVDAFFKALASGNPDTFEAMAKEHYAPDLLARRTPADRKQMVERIRGDFGQLTLGRDREAPRRPGDPRACAARPGCRAPSRSRSRRRRPSASRGWPSKWARPGLVRAHRRRPMCAATMTPAELAQGLDAYLAPLVASDAFSGVVLVARAGVPVYEKAFGLADRERNTSNTVDTRFNIGSINKIFTKTAVAQLVSQGKLKLSDTLGALLPDYPQRRDEGGDGGPAALAPGRRRGFLRPRLRAGARRIGSGPMPTTIGWSPRCRRCLRRARRRQYCNGCYIVLGAIIAKVSGMPYEDYIAAHVYTPAGMTTAGPTGQAAAVGYTRRAPVATGRCAATRACTACPEARPAAGTPRPATC